MDIYDLKTAQINFEELIPSLRAERQDLYNRRDLFRQYYTLECIKNMPIELYALGMKKPENGIPFCHTLEYALTGLGETKGAPASKFGVYFGRTKNDKTYKWRVTSRYGTADNIEDAFRKVRAAVYDLVVAGINNNVPEICNNTLPPIFKGKILSTFYPDRYLSVFSDNHLDHFLAQLGLDSSSIRGVNEVVKRNVLVDFKNRDVVMKAWSLDDYMVFLYRFYPKGPNKGNGSKDPLADYRDPVFAQFPEPEWIDLSIVSSNGMKETKLGNDTHTGEGNPDYNKDARKRKKIGNRGEEIVLQMERKRLREANCLNLAEQVIKAERDYEGYDIRSFEEDGSPRYIEVKSTTAPVGQANFFLSENEHNKSKTLKNYYIYMVYDIMSTTPKVWPIMNPFHPRNGFVRMTPMSYQIAINVSK